MRSLITKQINQKCNEEENDSIIFDRNRNEYVYIKKIETNSREHYESIVEELEQEIALRKSSLLCLIEYQAMPSIKKSCRIISAIYQYGEKCLFQEYEDRCQQRMVFEEDELWKILIEIVEGMSELERQNIGHGCISLKDIYLTGSGYKLVYPSLASLSPDTYSEGYYYSPQTLDYFNNLQHRQTTFTINIYKSDMFTLAICLLELALMATSSAIYSYGQFMINRHQFNTKIQQLKQHYSKPFIDVILCMSNFNYQERPNFCDLYSYLLSLLQLAQEEHHQEVEDTCNYQEICSEIDQQLRVDVLAEFYEVDRQEFHRNRSDEGKNQQLDENLSSIEEINIQNKQNSSFNSFAKQRNSLTQFKQIQMNYQIEPNAGQVYTDPQLLKILRSDVNEILKKRSKIHNT